MRMRLKYDIIYVLYNFFIVNVFFFFLEKEYVEECIEDFLEFKYFYLILNNRIC